MSNRELFERRRRFLELPGHRWMARPRGFLTSQSLKQGRNRDGPGGCGREITRFFARRSTGRVVDVMTPSLNSRKCPPIGTIRHMSNAPRPDARSRLAGLLAGTGEQPSPEIEQSPQLTADVMSGRRRKWDADDYRMRGLVPARPKSETVSLGVRVNPVTKERFRAAASERAITIGELLDDLAEALATP